MYKSKKNYQKIANSKWFLFKTLFNFILFVPIFSILFFITITSSFVQYLKKIKID